MPETSDWRAEYVRSVKRRIALEKAVAGIRGIVLHPRVMTAQNTGDRAQLNAVIDQVRAILLDEMRSRNSG